jgi:tRNA threonylcarbamoyladenosine modification (KEOPS) complex  Pcc1 subunit
MHAVVTYDGREADVIRDALRPEAGREIPSAQVSVKGEGDRVVIRVDAEDTAALRAALNSYLRWAQVALDVHRAVLA